MAAKVYCALDGKDLQKLVNLAHSVAPHVDGFKAGLEFFAARGPDGVRAIQGIGKPLFLDLKLHDIPNTVRGAVESLHPLSPSILTLHAAGGTDMLRAAVEGVRNAFSRDQQARLKLVGVTVLTSMDQQDLAAQGIQRSVGEHALELAKIVRAAGCHGVVCSPHEARALRDTLGNECFLVVPGVRPSWAGSDDQKRVMTPAEAARAGADVLVIGRPITQASNPAEAAQRIRDEVAAA